MKDLEGLKEKNPAFAKFGIKWEDLLLENSPILKTKTGIIYLIINMINGKVYVGQTLQSFNKRYKGRWWIYTDNDHLKKAANKYEKDNFRIIILEEGRGENILDILETYYTLTFQSHKEECGYNKTTGGQKYRLSEETRRKMSENHPFKRTTKEFIEQAERIHKDKYDYSNVNYKNSHIHVSIRCKICDKFFNQIPASHLWGQGCPDCGSKATALASQVTKEEFLQRFSNKFNVNDFDLSSDQYTSLSHGSITIIHKFCGKESIWTPPKSILSSTKGCKYCGRKDIAASIIKRRGKEDKETIRRIKLERGYQTYLTKCKQLHGNKFEYIAPSWKLIKYGFILQVQQKCNECGYTFYREGRVWNNGCPKCTQLNLGRIHNSHKCK